VKTEILNIDKAMEKSAELLKQGEVIAIPTDTVYGLSCNAYSETAIRKIYSIKQRPMDKALILFADSLDMAEELAEFSPAAKKLADTFWAGSLTMVLPSKTAGGNVGIRVPNNAFVLELIRRCGFPLATTSANTSGGKSPVTAEEVFADLNGKLPLIADGGKCAGGKPSTIVKIEPDNKNDEVQLLRLGDITLQQIQNIVNDKAK
jgi:L-threonylcarbamoyladenylate synthase